MQALLQRLEIIDVIGRIATLADASDQERLAGYFTADARLEVISEGAAVGHWEGRAALIERFGQTATDGSFQARHLVTNHVFDNETPTSAQVSSYLTLLRHDAAGLHPISSGRYIDEFVREADGAWRIANKRILLDVKVPAVRR